MKIVYIICCNDLMVHAVVNDETLAKVRLVRLRLEHYEGIKYEYENFADYRNQFYWHIHDVEGE